MAQMTISKSDLLTLLKRTQRLATINGKQISQVHGTILEVGNGEVRTFSIVRDGTSSISTFSCDVASHNEGEIPVSDIALLIGALSKHGSEVDISFHDGKIRIKSAHKQTTLQSSAESKAFSHTKKTLKEWCADSKTRFKHCIETNTEHYTMKNGDFVEPSFKVRLDSQHLCSAIESGTMNGQKVEHYKFNTADQKMFVEVGAVGKGKTKTLLHEAVSGGLPISNIGGGLENVLRTVNGEVFLAFFDLTPFGGGMSLRLSFNGGCVFQREGHVHASN